MNTLLLLCVHVYSGQAEFAAELGATSDVPSSPK
jgi:hypothetical protein